MHIGGLQKLTLIDFPGKVATTVFTVGCSFKCAFCHNPELVIPEQFPSENMEKMFFRFLEQRKGKIEGVCITGGEPTIQRDIIPFMRKIRSMGFALKLDTNGTRPEVLRKILKENLVDYIAMDIKNSLEKYSQTVGVKTDTKKIELSVELIRSSKVLYEFRTTVVPGMHEKEDFLKIADWLKGSNEYYLQPFRKSKHVDDSSMDIDMDKKLNLEDIVEAIRDNFEKVGIKE